MAGYKKKMYIERKGKESHSREYQNRPKGRRKPPKSSIQLRALLMIIALTLTLNSKWKSPSVLPERK